MLDKATLIVDSFRPTGGPYPLAELAERTGLPKPTVHRLAADLVRLGWLERTERARYRLAGKLSELGSLVPGRPNLGEAALPFLRDLHEATREMVHLGVREGSEVLQVEGVLGHHPLQLPSPAAGGLPLNCTAAGKALLAFSGAEPAESLPAQPLPGLTPHSVTDPERLRTALEQVQVSGLAYDDQEAVPGVSCVAAPVFDGGSAVAALSVAVPRERYRPAQLAPAVRTAALGLSRTLSRGDRPG